MKSNILLLSTVLAAVAALVALIPVNALADAGNALVALGILAIFAVDYGRTLAPPRFSARVLAFDAGGRRPIDLGRAA